MTSWIFHPIPAGAVSYGVTHSSLLAQGISTDILRIGSQGKDVEELQIQLQNLGYYSGAIDGKYGVTTRNAVYKFQQEQDLSIDGTVGNATRKRLQIQVNKASSLPTATPKLSKNPPQSSGKNFVWWSLMGIGFLGSVGALLYCVKWFAQKRKLHNTDIYQTDSTHNQQLLKPPVTTLDSPTENQVIKVTTPKAVQFSPPQTKLLPTESISQLAKVNIVEELVTDLSSQDGSQRRKAIWDLGQQGDSRAIQPLVDLMVNVDSQQRSLILAALAEISTRNLKPINRALAISLQDESPQVRQNAIRDLTQIYDMMTQVSQMLYHATEDVDAEVQATAKYALGKMNRMRSLSNDLSSSSHSSPQNLAEHQSTEREV
ncbi:MAG: peptidoglycan-binding protein [Calothrix sp. MO_167.B42]|nr:peptidoglycan-binding protein [Calothrix sp. MO_167.B42]